MFNKNFSKEPTEKQKLGQVGEKCACDYLIKNGYEVIERNYLKKWGELDIIATKDKIIHFVEVKSVSWDLSKPVIRETVDDYRPEDNMHPWKLKRLSRAVQSYLLERNVGEDREWTFDVALVYVDQEKRLSKVFLLEDIVL